MYAQPAAPRTRPTTVTVSSYLLFVAAGVGLLSAVLSLTQVSTISQVYRDAYAGTSSEGMEVVIVGTTIVGVVINVLFSAGLVVLALFNNRGRQGSRVTTWVIGGISLCCSALGVASTAVTSSMNLDSGTGPSSSEVERRLSDALPSWYQPLTVVLAILSVLSILVALILLALPASNAFFRPAQAGFDPSMPYPYPGYPGQAYPAQPGYPPYPPPPGAAPPGTPPGWPPSGPLAGPSSGSLAGPLSGPPAEPSGPPAADPWQRPPGDEPPQDRPPTA